MTFAVGLGDAADDLMRTYLAIGSASAGTESHHQERWVACRNPRPHPIGNFAVCRSDEESDIRAILAWAGSRQSYLIYTFSEAESPAREQRWQHLGLRHHHVLAMLMAAPRENAQAPPLESIETRADRLRVTSFMAQQFFEFQSREYREVVAEATAGCGLPVAMLRDGQNVAAAAMFSFRPTLIGVYNLCVASGLRQRGWGSALVEAIRHLGDLEQRPISLQCETELTGWYEARGFELIGKVDVWTLDPRQSHVIIE